MASRRRSVALDAVVDEPAQTDIAASGPASVQIFGRRDSRDTQKAQRFFRERRIPVSYVDLATRPMARAELQRFSERFGPRDLVDQHSRAYADAGLGYLSLTEAELFDRLLADQRLIRLPLVRAGQQLSVGLSESAWRSWLVAFKAQ